MDGVNEHAHRLNLRRMTASIEKGCGVGFYIFPFPIVGKWERQVETEEPERAKPGAEFWKSPVFLMVVTVWNCARCSWQRGGGRGGPWEARKTLMFGGHSEEGGGVSLK